jgi:hypothetical protein
MGKRSRLVTMRRKRRQDLEKSVQIRGLTNLRAVAFCCIVAMLSERHGSAFVVGWIRKHMEMSEDEAAESIAIGRRWMARSP